MKNLCLSQRIYDITMYTLFTGLSVTDVVRVLMERGPLHFIEPWR